MFLLVALVAAAAFATEVIFSASLYRRLPSAAVSSIRGMSFSISMFPLVVWAGLDAWRGLDSPTFALLMVGAVVTFTANVAYGIAIRSLQLGMASALGLSSMTLTVLVCGQFVLQERMSAMQQSAVLLLIVSNILVAVGKPSVKTVENTGGRATAMLLAILFGLLGGLGNFCMNLSAQRIHPFIAGYIWDVGAGIFGFLFLTTFGRNPFREVSAKDCGRILLYCSPAAIGIGAFAYSVTLGPVGLANALIINGVLIGSALLANVFYRERLRPLQWIGIVLVCIAIALVKS